MLLVAANFVEASDVRFKSERHITLPVIAVNPSHTEQSVRIKSYLPSGIKTNDIISLDGLSLGYDVKKDLYYVHDEIVMGRGEKTFNVVIRNKWVVSEQVISMLLTHASQLVKKLDGLDSHAQGIEFENSIERALKQIQDRQRETGIEKPGITASYRVSVYDPIKALLNHAKADIGRLENLVLGSGQDVGEILGHGVSSLKRVRSFPGLKH